MFYVLNKRSKHVRKYNEFNFYDKEKIYFF